MRIETQSKTLITSGFGSKITQTKFTQTPRKSMAITPSDNSAHKWPSLPTDSKKSNIKPGAKSPGKKKQAEKNEVESRISNQGSALPASAPVDEFNERIQKFRNQRCMKLWMILMASLGHLPYANRRNELKDNDKSFANNYKKRLRFLKGRTTISPKEGLALCLPYHAMKESDKKSEQYYDVVSTLNVLQSSGYEIPATVEAMISDWKQIPLPPGSHDIVPEDEKEKRDITARIIAGMNKNLQMLLVELIRLHYKQVLTAQTRGDILQLMVKDLIHGPLGKESIETQLKLLQGIYES